MYMRVYTFSTGLSDFLVYFESTTEKLRDNFQVLPIPGSSVNSVSLANVMDKFYYLNGANVSYNLHLPKDHVLMISFPVFDVEDEKSYPDVNGLYSLICVDYLEMYTSSNELLWRKCGVQFINASLYNQSLSLRFVSNAASVRVGFQLYFSIHNASAAPVQSADGMFDCSRHYDTFRPHLDCNLRQECEGGEDEHRGCPYNMDTRGVCGHQAVLVEVQFSINPFTAEVAIVRLLGSAPKSHLCDQRRRSKGTGLSDLMTLFIDLGCLYCKQTQRAFYVFKNMLN
jgi:hypothetical protein